MTHAFSDVLLVGGRPNQWVKYVNNDGNAAHVYVSTTVTTFQSATTGAGVYTFNPSPIGGIYTSYLIDGSLSATAPAAADIRWAATGITSHVVAYTAGDDAALDSVTASSGPNTNTLADGVTATPAGVVTGKTWDQGGAVFNVNAYGAKADQRTVTDAAIGTGTPNLTSATAAFTSSDVGKLVAVVGAGAAGAALITTILAYVSATAVTLTANAGGTVSGATCDIVTDDRAAFVLAIAAMGTQAGIIECPSHRYVIGSTIQTNLPGIAIQSTNRTSGGNPGTIMEFAGTGPLFDLGTDNGFAYDGNYYDGVENFTLRDIALTTKRPSTALDNGQGFYRTGTIGVRDWRGGDQRWSNVNVFNFDYPFWGIQSDINQWDHVTISNCHSGVYAGPRSDQFTFDTCYWIYNDRAVDNDRSLARFKDCQFVNNGAVGTNPIKVHSAWTNGQWGTVFEDCWFEQYLGVAAALESFIEFGVGDTVQSSQLHIIRPTILTNVSGGGPHMKYLVKVGNATHVQVEEPTAQIFTTGAPGTAANIEALISCAAATSPDLVIKLPKTYTAATSFFATVATSGGATPTTTILAWGSSGWQVFKGALMVGNDTLAADPELQINSAAGQNRTISLRTAGVSRWVLRANNTAEGGANAGSDFEFISRDDTGALLKVVLGITRSTGLITLADAVNIALNTTTGTKIGTGTTQKLGFFNAAPVAQPANTDDLRTALINLGLYASGGATPLNLNGGAFTAGFNLTLSGAAGATRDILLQTAGVSRWILRVDNTAEGGANAGSNLALLSRSDAGAAVATVLQITRSNNNWTLADPTVIITGTTTGLKLGSSTSDKLAFHGSTAVIQRAGAAQVAAATTGSTNTGPFGYTTAAQADAIVALVNELRAAMVEKGLIKGAA